MFSTRLVAIGVATAAFFGGAAAQSQPPQSPARYVLDDVDPGWTYSAGATRIEDTDESVWYGGYTQLPAGGTATASFSGSGIAVWFTFPPGPAGSLKFYFDDALRLTYFLEASNATQYNVKAFSWHKRPIAAHTLKVVSDSLIYAVDTAIYNPGAPSPDDPSDE